MAEGESINPLTLSQPVVLRLCLCLFLLNADVLSRVFLQEYNLKYVDMIEEQLNEALTTYRKPVDGDNYVRRSNQRS